MYSLALLHYPTFWSLNPVVSLTPHTIHPLLKLLPFPFPLRCSSACLSFYSSSSPSPLLRLRLKRRLINTGNKFLLANFPNKVTGRPSSLLYDHLVLCMSISSLHPSLSNSLFPPTHVDSTASYKSCRFWKHFIHCLYLLVNKSLGRNVVGTLHSLKREQPRSRNSFLIKYFGFRYLMLK